MLSELFIHNFAIIDELRLNFHAGFNVLTGETGAGKSIILDAVDLVLGGRADTSLIRAGCNEAQVEATFKLNPALQKALAPLITTEELEGETEDTIVLAREIRDNGRSVARVNGRSVNLAILRQVAAPLIDIHGQGEHLSLLQPRSHLPLLDAYAGLSSATAAVAREVGQLQTIQREMAELKRDERLLNQRIDMLQFQVEEIRAANLKADEEEELRAERARLANAEQLTRSATESIAHLVGVADLAGGEDADDQTILDRLGQVERALTTLVRFDESKNSLLENVQGLSFQLNEVASELQDYLDDLEFNPKRLDFIEERLELIIRLKRKYGATLADVIAAGDQAAEELDKISHSEERMEKLKAEQESYLKRIGRLAQALSQQRQAAAAKLAQMIEIELTDLRMEGTKFSVDFQSEADSEGLYVGDKRLAFDRSGYDRVEFLISPNPGEPLKPMAKVASGGETARLMLALKTALAKVDATPTLIFDEIDQGIGGRVGDIVGRKLWGLSHVGQHQVIVVTHLPQLAGYGDIHFQVAKKVVGGRTTTTVLSLDKDGKITELAAMLGTRDEHARNGATSILNQAAAAKEK